MQNILEVCVDSVESAVIAQRGGADRLEGCSNLVIGGATPGVSQFQQIRRACGINLHVLIRPRFGDFLYTDAEFQMIEADMRMFLELGADGVVVGCLNADGTLDADRMERLKKLAGNAHMTLHRAFDVCRDADTALAEAMELGIDSILTSGQAQSCLEGKEKLRHLVARAGNKIEIMAGGGVEEGVIRTLWKECGVRSFHMSGKEELDSGMRYRNADVNMGLPGLEEFVIFRTQEALVKQAKEAMQSEALT